jgi:hypothetical protein
MGEIFINNLRRKMALHYFTTIGAMVLILYGVLISILFIFGIDLLNRFLKVDSKTRSQPAYQLFFVISMGTIGYAFYMIPATINYFFTQNSSDWVFAIQQLIVMIILIPFAVTAEKNLLSYWRNKQKTKKKESKFHLFTLLGAISLLYLFGVLLIEIFDTNDNEIIDGHNVFIPTWVILAIFSLFGFIGFLHILFIQFQPSKEIKEMMLKGLLAAIIGLIGGLIAGLTRSVPPIAVEDQCPSGLTCIPNTGGNRDVSYIIGTVIEIIGWLFMRNFILSIPNYGELEWKSKIREFFILENTTGNYLFFKAYRRIKPEELKGNWDLTIQTSSEEADADFEKLRKNKDGISSVITKQLEIGINVANINIEKVSLLFKRGKNIICMLISDENRPILHDLLSQCLKKIEEKDLRNDTISKAVNEIFG